MKLAVFIVLLIIGMQAGATASTSAPRNLAVKLRAPEPDSLEVIEEDFGDKNEKPLADAKFSDKESEIPVLTHAAPAKPESSNPFYRMLVALSVIVAAGVGTLIYAKRFKKDKTSPGPQTKIQILTQHYLGPKKSLAVIKVAGESILIGITDHNISPIRVLSLLDDELPAQTPEDFNAAMTEIEFAEENQEADEFQYQSMRRI